MSYIAIEEAFTVPGLADRQPRVPNRFHVRRECAEDWARRLGDFEEYRLPDMDANDIDMQVLSLSVPGIQADKDPASAVHNAVFANDFLAEQIARHPDRFAGFAALPMQDPEAAVAELQRAVTDLGFVGALVNDHTHGRYLDDPAYDQFWATLSELDKPLYLHPGSVSIDDWEVLRGRPELYGATWSWQAETGGHALRLIYSGVFDRHPGARLVLGHLGEFLPFQTSRLDSRYRTLETESSLQRRPSEYFGRNVFLTTSGVLSPAAVQAAVLVAGEDSVMFSIDYPYEVTSEAVAAVAQAELSDAARRKVSRDNAAALLGLTGRSA